MPTWTDGDFPSGTPIITIERGTTDLVAICDDWNYDNNTREITRTDQNAEETDAKGIPENPSGSATVQIETATTVRLTPGETFTVTTPASDTELNGIVFIIKTASSPRVKDAGFTQSITFRKRINTPP